MYTHPNIISLSYTA
ncbi:hypothetical protein CAEBREN_17979 [Caenorhabditis brenneri]|uniref:Uncharacterized protein n=1 Tax=Caenorhabditis brenneri TaxID=135651 RepID=G0MR24_CAEBE|nr:hypothetical protein CAEBREN_17979 [Caenorhabditis brenneri]